MVNKLKGKKFAKANVFKQIEQIIFKIRKELKVAEGEDKKLLNQQHDLALEVLEYIKTYKWLKKQATKERVQTFIQSRYDYGTMCTQLGICYDVAKSSISYAQTVLKDKIGNYTLNMIIEGDIDGAKAIFYTNTGQIKLSTFLLDFALVEIPDASYMTVPIADCHKELIYLQQYSKTMLEKRVEDIDKDKLAYLKYLFETDNPKFVKDKIELIKLLQLEATVDSFISKRKELEVL